MKIHFICELNSNNYRHLPICRGWSGRKMIKKEGYISTIIEDEVTCEKCCKRLQEHHDLEK